jgi:glycosyltransferase involved in cell wall biosynthesis
MVSIIIPAHNEAEYLPYTLRSVLIATQQVPENCQIIVVDDASTDATSQIAGESGATVVAVNLRHIAAVRNAGARAATGDLLVFLDADTRLPVDTLQAAIRLHKLGFVGGGCRIEFDKPLSRLERAMCHLWHVPSRIFRLAAGSFFFADRKSFERIGGFDERFYAAEEVFTSLALQRLGPFTVLGQTVITSARKLESHSLGQYLGTTARGALTLGRSLRRREGLGLWYDPRPPHPPKS